MDTREKEAKYFNRNPKFLNDIPFYQRLLPGDRCRVLELGCGTVRVLVPRRR